jgi:hypothetical protein
MLRNRPKPADHEVCRSVRRSFCGLLVVFLVDSVACETLRAQSPRARRIRSEITSQLELSVDRGFRYLIGQQRPSGDFSDQYQVAVNSLVGIAFLSGGHTTRVGPYTEVLQRSVDKLLEFQKPDGYFTHGSGVGQYDSMMYGHGFATLFLAELYGMTGSRDARIREALTRAVRLIEKHQCSDGGWDYYPSESHETKTFFRLLGRTFVGTGDTSITVCQTMALRAARNLGLKVDHDVVARARVFIEKAQNPDGGFAYRRVGGFPISLAERSDFPRSAAGVCVLTSLGDYNSTRIRKGYDYLLKHYSDSSDFPYYGYYYCGQAMFQAGGRYWRTYFPYIRERLLYRQARDGSWKPGRAGDPAQSTAMALIVLQIPYRFLPIFER